MNAEWEELKDFIDRLPCDGIVMAKTKEVIQIRMTEIERLTLPERVAEIVEKADHGLVSTGVQMGGCWGTELAFPIIANALRTGDTSEIQKWVKK